MIVCTAIVLSSLFAITANALDNGLALTPPMGWMSWQRYRCVIDCDKYPNECVSERLFKNAADRLAADGYRDAGYEYLIVDDCWMENQRDADGRLVPDRKRFPSGMKALADYVHAKGLKFGIYEDYGTHTCAGYPGVIGHEETDANTFASWDVDYVKLDGCYAKADQMEEGYKLFGALLNRTGRPMVYSCSWPAYQLDWGEWPKYDVLKKHCNLWRNFDDIDDSWESIRSITKYFAGNQTTMQPHAGPGHWNDPDMLIIGNFGLTIEQSKAQMAIWAILAAPLIMSNDLDNVRPEFKEILLNRQVIAVNQDSLGIQGLRVEYSNTKIEVWVRQINPIVNNATSLAIAFTSHRVDGFPREITITTEKLKMTHPDGYKCHDLFNPSKTPFTLHPTRNMTVRVAPSGGEFYKCIPKSNDF